MRLPVITGIIDRRILANFRVDPDYLAKTLPAPFRPQLIQGYGIAGICLIRMKQLRPSFMPAILGLSSENAAHRIAVEWDSPEGVKTGVYVPRRDTSACLNVLAGGTIFPGVQNRASFKTEETETRFFVEMTSSDGAAHVLVDSVLSQSFPESSVFDSLDHVSAFFEQGSKGFSPDRSGKSYDGLELQTKNWRVESLDVTEVRSSFFQNPANFPESAVEFDNALLMRDIDHEWHELESICCD